MSEDQVREQENGKADEMPTEPAPQPCAVEQPSEEVEKSLQDKVMELQEKEAGKAPEKAPEEMKKDQPKSPPMSLFNKDHYVVKDAMAAGILRQQMLRTLANMYMGFLTSIDEMFQLPPVQRQNAQIRLDEGFMWLEKGIMSVPMVLEDQQKKNSKQSNAAVYQPPVIPEV